jgi:hypothetical protein
LDSIDGQLNFDDELMSDYYDELASSIYWWAEPGRNRYGDLTPIQQAKFSGLVMSITKKKGIAKTSALRRFIDIVGNEPKKRFVGKPG